LNMVHTDKLTVVQLDPGQPSQPKYGPDGLRPTETMGTVETVEKPLRRNQGKTGNNTEMDTYYNNYQVQRLLQAYGNWVRGHMDRGWHGYFLSFMFSQIPGSDASRLQEMKKHLGWFYGRLAKASVPKASSSEWSEFLPKAVLAPDLPVPKHSKVRLRDVTINDGLHWHGLMVVNPSAPKLQTRLDLHIKANLRKYLVGSIREIDVTPITYTQDISPDMASKPTKIGSQRMKSSSFRGP
jgi:hypothetical protein